MRKLLMLLAALLCALPALAEDPLNIGEFHEESEELITQYAGFTWTQPLFDVYLSCDAAAWEMAVAAQGFVLTEENEGHMRRLAPTVMYNLLNSAKRPRPIIERG